jgi:hypothetical protein
VALEALQARRVDSLLVQIPARPLSLAQTPRRDKLRVWGRGGRGKALLDLPDSLETCVEAANLGKWVTVKAVTACKTTVRTN